MPLIKCTHCGATGNAPDHVLGSQVRCSKCKQSFVASTGESAPPPLDDAFDEPEETPDDDRDEPRDEDDEIEERPRRRSSRRDEPEDDEKDDDREMIRIRKPTAGGIGDILLFRKLFGKGLVQVVFWLGIAAVLLYALMFVIAFSQGGATGVLVGLLLALFAILIGPIIVRLYTELAAAVFQINETLIEIRDELRRDKKD